MKTVKYSFYVLLIAVLAALTVSCYKSVEYKGTESKKDHHGADRFISQAQKTSPMWSYLKMRFKEGGMPTISEDELDKMQVEADQALINTYADEPRATWLGHATVLVQYAGKTLLTDPHLTERAGPLPFWVPKRLLPPGLSLDQLPNIDYVVISHNHYDHLDDATVQGLGNSVIWFVPLGLKEWLMRREISAERIVELDWWESWAHDERVKITLTPNKHWSKRTAFDTNKTLWGGWSVNIDDFKVWFAGDTGYDADMFKQIGYQLGPFDLGLIPIGAYGPRYFMLPQHVDPQQALLIHQDIKATTSIGIHWGTFQLSHEPYMEPAQLLKQAQEQTTSSDGSSFVTIPIGQTLIIE